MIRSYGGLNPTTTTTIAQRWFFLIDKQGIVRGQWRGNPTDVAPSEPILKVARELAGR